MGTVIRGVCGSTREVWRVSDHSTYIENLISNHICGSRVKADAVYKSGIARKARPTKGLQEHYDKFLSRGPVVNSASACTSGSTASAAKAGSSPTESGSDAAKHKRYAYIRAHLKGSGAPAPGKRAERFAYDFRKLYTLEGAEFSAEEARARSLGLYGKRWTPLESEPPFTPEVAGARGAEGDISLDSSPPARVAVRFEDGPRNPGGFTTSAPLGAEPTMTINTKEALADVMQMYNSPERTARFANKALGSKHAPLKRVEPFRPSPAPQLARSQSDENANAGKCEYHHVPLRKGSDLIDLATFRPYSNDENRTPGSSRLPGM
jgi:checkpoint serine/threonine-protein kinase